AIVFIFRFTTPDKKKRGKRHAIIPEGDLKGAFDAPTHRRGTTVVQPVRRLTVRSLVSFWKSIEQGPCQFQLLPDSWWFFAKSAQIETIRTGTTVAAR
ncbi:MAG TPA: hypothetical protein VLA26_12045, partial [Gammaproteobacteria bacterium]|nr:hypothetical protein [Gammaproteobacteria bacterium]